MANYDVEITFKAINKDDGSKAVTTQTYENLSYAALLAMEEAVIPNVHQALIGLGKQKLGAK